MIIPSNATIEISSMDTFMKTLYIYDVVQHRL